MAGLSRTHFLARAGRFAKDCELVGSKAKRPQSEKLRTGIVRRMYSALMNVNQHLSSEVCGVVIVNVTNSELYTSKEVLAPFAVPMLCGQPF